MPKQNLLAFAIFLAVFQIFFAADANAADANAQTSRASDFKERFVVQSVRTIFSAEMTYLSTVGAGQFASLDELRQADFIDSVLASGEKYGYSFVLTKIHATATSPAKFTLNATPRSYPKNGRRSFYIDETGETHAADKNGAAADANDPVISECDSYGITDNERCTVWDLRRIMIAQMLYYSTAGNNSYGTFAQLRAAGLIPARLATGTNNDYAFTVELINQTPNSPAVFKLRATPVNYGVTGIRSFYLDNDSIMRGADRQGQPANETDPPINF